MASRKTDIRRVYNAFFYSCKGLRAAWKHESAFRQEILCICPACLFVIFLPITTVEKVVLILSAGLILVAELLNSALEATVDRIGEDRHELSGRAKDMGSAAVLCAVILAVVVWVLVLGHNFI